MIVVRYNEVLYIYISIYINIISLWIYTFIRIMYIVKNVIIICMKRNVPWRDNYGFC